MLLFKRKVQIPTERLMLRLPLHRDYRHWSELRLNSKDFLSPWEPSWATDHLSRKSFANRVYWAQRSVTSGSGIPLFIERQDDGVLLGAVTLDNMRRGPAQAATLGYWIGAPYARQGYMREALIACVNYAFHMNWCHISYVELLWHEITVPFALTASQQRGILSPPIVSNTTSKPLPPVC